MAPSRLQIQRSSSRGLPSPGIGRSPVPRVSISNRLSKTRDIATLEATSTIGDFYDFGGVLGRGGFGVVSEIRHAKTFEPFAGKVLRKETFDGLPAKEEVFRKVMGTLLNNEHPHIVRLLHVFEDESNYYIVMDICQGGTISCLVHSVEQPLPVFVIEDVLEQTIRALSFLHGLRMLHRDVKPANVMLRSDTEVSDIMSGSKKTKVALVDFDLCRFLDEQGEVVCSQTEGTFGYLAPELLESHRYTVMSDVFAFGCLTYFVLTEEEPCPDLPSTHGKSTEELIEAMDGWLSSVRRQCEEHIGSEETLRRGRASSMSSMSCLSSRSSATGAGGGGGSGCSGMALPLPDSVQPAEAEALAPCALPARFWRLLRWCVEEDPAKRPASALAVMQSEWLRDEARNRTSSKLSAPPRPAEEDRSPKTPSINDLLRLKVQPLVRR